MRGGGTMWGMDKKVKRGVGCCTRGSEVNHLEGSMMEGWTKSYKNTPCEQA